MGPFTLFQYPLGQCLAFKNVQIWAIKKIEVNLHILPCPKTLRRIFYFGLKNILYTNNPSKKEEGSYNYSSTMGTKLRQFLGVISLTF
jgi:hypothetical protein